MDKDILEFQFRESVVATCSKCEDYNDGVETLQTLADDRDVRKHQFEEDWKKLIAYTGFYIWR